MSKIKVKQIYSDGQPAGAILVTDGNGNNSWVVQQAVSGSDTYLGLAEDGSYTESRYNGGKAPAVGLAPTTKVSTAIDSINEVLGLLLPNAPAPLSSGVLSLVTANTSQRAAQGYTTNSVTSAPAAGVTVSRITAATADTNTLQDLGDGGTGTVTFVKDGAAVSGENFTFTGTVGEGKSTGVLRISDNKWGGTDNGGNAAPAGFFQSFDSALVGAAATVGLNAVQIQHSVSGNTNVLQFVRDDLTAVPAVSGVTITEISPTKTQSSGINHYASGATLGVTGTATNLAGQTYLAGTILSLSGPGNTINFAAGQAGLPAILNVNTLSYNMPSQTFTVGGTIFSKTQNITLAASNPNGTGSAASGKSLLVLSGTPTLQDAGISAFGTALAAKRVAFRTVLGDTPAASNITGTNSGSSALAWNSADDLSSVGMTGEAALVGGFLTNDKTNYTLPIYMPTGLDYSAKDAAQYVTYRFNVPAKSAFTLTVTGTYSGLWVALPGISTDSAQSPAAINGAWWDAKAVYNGAGVPGRAGDTTAGCAVGSAASGTSGAVGITFGTASSSNSTNNAVFVRMRLNAGDSITALSIS